MKQRKSPRFGHILCPILQVVDLRPSVTVESRESESETRLRLSVSVLSKLSALVVCSAGGGMELADMVSCVLCHLWNGQENNNNTTLKNHSSVAQRESDKNKMLGKYKKRPINKSASISGIWRFNKILKYLTSRRHTKLVKYEIHSTIFSWGNSTGNEFSEHCPDPDEVLSACHCLSTLEGVEISDWLETEASLASLTHYCHSDVITSLTFIWNREENKKWHSKGMVCSINPCLLTGRGDRGDSHTETSLQAPAPAPRVKVTAAIGRGQSPWHSAEYASSTPPTLTVILTSSPDHWPVRDGGWSTITNQSRGNTRPGILSTLHQCKCHGWRQDYEPMGR